MVKKRKYLDDGNLTVLKVNSEGIPHTTLSDVAVSASRLPKAKATDENINRYAQAVAEGKLKLTQIPDTELRNKVRAKPIVDQIIKDRDKTAGPIAAATIGMPATIIGGISALPYLPTVFNAIGQPATTVVNAANKAGVIKNTATLAKVAKHLDTGVDIAGSIEGLYNAATDNGIKKTVRLAREGDYLGAIKSGAIDAVDIIGASTLGLKGRNTLRQLGKFREENNIKNIKDLNHYLYNRKLQRLAKNNNGNLFPDLSQERAAETVANLRNDNNTVRRNLEDLSDEQLRDVQLGAEGADFDINYATERLAENPRDSYYRRILANAQQRRNEFINLYGDDVANRSRRIRYFGAMPTEASNINDLDLEGLRSLRRDISYERGAIDYNTRMLNEARAANNTRDIDYYQRDIGDRNYALERFRRLYGDDVETRVEDLIQNYVGRPRTVHHLDLANEDIANIPFNEFHIEDPAWSTSPLAESYPYGKGAVRTSEGKTIHYLDQPSVEDISRIQREIDNKPQIINTNNGKMSLYPDVNVFAKNITPRDVRGAYYKDLTPSEVTAKLNADFNSIPHGGQAALTSHYALSTDSYPLFIKDALARQARNEGYFDLVTDDNGNPVYQLLNKMGKTVRHNKELDVTDLVKRQQEYINYAKSKTGLPISDALYYGDQIAVPAVRFIKYRLGGSVNRHSLKDGGIYIQPSHRGRFTALKERTGHSTSWYKEHGTPAEKKMAIFADNAKHWNH